MDNKQSDMSKDLKFDDAVIAKIVGLTSQEVAGVYSLEGGMVANMTDFFRQSEDATKGVDVDMGDDQTVSVSLDATLRYGDSAPEVFNKVTSAIARNVKQMTGLTVTDVKMTVKDMLTKEEIAQNEAKEKKDQEKKAEKKPDHAPEPQPA